LKREKKLDLVEREKNSKLAKSGEKNRERKKKRKESIKVKIKKHKSFYKRK